MANIIEQYEETLELLNENLVSLTNERDTMEAKTDLNEEQKAAKRVKFNTKIATAKNKITAQQEKIEKKVALQKAAEDKKVVAEQKVAASEQKAKAIDDERQAKFNQKLADKHKQLEQVEQLQAEDDDRMYKYFKDLLSREKLSYIMDANCYTEYFANEDVWRNYKVQSLYEAYPVLREKQAKKMFDFVMDEYGRKYKSVANSFNPCPDYILNKISRDGWLQPTQGEHSEWFDLILHSLGGGKQENIDHLEHVLAWKYLHPEDFQLPCIVIFGEGGVGKNLFIVILSTIFGKNQCASVDMDEVTGDFNNLVVGKTVLFIDEAVMDNSNMSALKRCVHNPTRNINEKYGPKYVAENTPLYLTGGNDVMAAVRLADDATDRRWSILSVHDPLVDVIAKWFPELKDASTDDIIRVRDYGVDEVMKNPEEVSKWLGYLIKKWGKKRRPQALHGEDYKALLTSQSGPFEEVCERIFMDEEFEYISGKVLWQVYKEVYDDAVPAGRGGHNKYRFMAEVKHWIKKKKLPVHRDENINLIKGDTRTSTTGYVSNTVSGRIQWNDSKYWSKIGGHKLPSVSPNLSVVR